ncbi:hypothetical protein JCM19236_3203 [Vibrio sp. JCM 19236]|nr:hypothetical protein JCM19236_3203 [Vibrio sp. JCM 19236]
MALLPVAAASITPAFAETIDNQVNLDALPSYKQDADLIKHTFETQLYTLPAFKMGHYGLRMYRQTQDSKYQAAVWADMARVASRLNEFATEVHTPEQIKAYSDERMANYDKHKDERSLLRYNETIDQKEYPYLGIDLLAPWLVRTSMALSIVKMRNYVRSSVATTLKSSPPTKA